MSRSSARLPAIPSAHTRKCPDRCPHGGSRNLPKKGVGHKKFETAQLWRCRACRRVFTPAPAALRNKTYAPRVIIDALTWYDLGYTLDDTRKKLKARYGLSIASSSIAGWFAEHKSITSYRRLRPTGMWLFSPKQTVRAASGFLATQPKSASAVRAVAAARPHCLPHRSPAGSGA